MSTKYKILFIVTPLIFILDQLSKWVIITNIKIGDGFSVIQNYFDIVHVTNTGAAFGMLAGAASSFRVPFFYLISAIAVIIIAVMLIKLPKDDKLLALVFSLILGGVAGNITDRLRFGAVTDFLSVHIHDLYWPAFNIADSAITVSMFLLIWSLFRAKKSN